VLIRDNQVIIPVMDIRSNALDLTASGTHGFNNHYDYRIRLLLSDLLYNKARHSGNTEFQTSTDESDTRTLFLKIRDSGAGSTVQLDRERTAEKIRNDLKEEKAQLKVLLNEELGLFKRDEEVARQRKQQDRTENLFKFEFLDEPDSTATNDRTREKGRRWRKRIKKDTVENKPARRFVIDERP
jgi:hypothetical protein